MAQATAQEFARELQSGLAAGVSGTADVPVPLSVAQEVTAGVPQDAPAGSPLFVDIPGKPPAPAGESVPLAAGLRFKASSSANTRDLSPELVGRLNTLYDAMPAELRDQGFVNSGARTTEQQAELHRRLAPQGARVAAPGRSRHEIQNGAAAVDFADNAALKWLWSPAGKTALTAAGLEAPFGDDRGHVQLVGANAAPVVEGKPGPNQASWRDFHAEMQEPSGARPSGSVSTALGDIMNAAGGAVGRAATGLFTEDLPRMGEDAAAFASGVRKGLMDVPLGAAQTVLPRAAMEPVEDAMRQFENNFRTLQENNPVADTAGRIVGSTLGIMGAARLLGPAVAPFTPALITRALTAVGAGGRGALAGAAGSGTLFYPEGPEREKRFGAEEFVPGGARGVDALLGGTLGLAAKPILAGVSWAARNLSDTALARSFLQVIRANAEDVTRNSERPLREALGHYETVETTARARYALRNRAGEQFEGFESGVGEGAPDGFKQALDRTLEASKSAGVQVRGTVQTVARQVKDILGITQQEAAAARAQAAAQRMLEQVPPGLSPTAQTQVRAQLGIEAFKPELVSAAQYAEARTAINDAMKTKNTAARTQLRGMLREIDSVVKDAAASHNMPVQTFLRRAEEVARYYRENVVPLRQFFDNRTSQEVRDSAATMRGDAMTPAAFYDRVVKLVESGDRARIETLAKTLGPTGKTQLTRLLAAEATAQLTAKGDMAAVQYVRANEDALRALLGRREFDELMGASKIAETVFNRVKKEATRDGAAKRTVIHGWGPAFGVYELGHALVNAASGTGTVGRHLMTAGVMFTAMPALHLARRVVGDLHNNARLAPLVRSAARMRPGSAELEELVNSVERQLRLSAAATARGAGTAAQQSQ